MRKPWSCSASGSAGTLDSTIRKSAVNVLPTVALIAMSAVNVLVSCDGVPVTITMSEVIAAVAGVTPALSTTGGTSDARFLSQICPTVEFGLVNATMHKTDEAVAVADLETLTEIYADIIARVAKT